MRSSFLFNIRSNCERRPTNRVPATDDDRKVVSPVPSIAPNATTPGPPRHLRSRNSIPAPQPCDDALRLHNRSPVGRAHHQSARVVPEKHIAPRHVGLDSIDERPVTQADLRAANPGQSNTRRRHARQLSSGRSRHQPLQQRLLGVHAVAGLLEDDAARAVEHVVGDLLAAVGRQAVHQPACAAAPAPAAAAFTWKPANCAQALLALRFLAHARPDVGVDHVGLADRVSRVAVLNQLAVRQTLLDRSAGRRRRSRSRPGRRG